MAQLIKLQPFEYYCALHKKVDSIRDPFKRLHAVIGYCKEEILWYKTHWKRTQIAKNFYKKQFESLKIMIENNNQILNKNKESKTLLTKLKETETNNNKLQSQIKKQKETLNALEKAIEEKRAAFELQSRMLQGSLSVSNKFQVSKISFLKSQLHLKSKSKSKDSMNLKNKKQKIESHSKAQNETQTNTQHPTMLATLASVATIHPMLKKAFEFVCFLRNRVTNSKFVFRLFLFLVSIVKRVLFFNSFLKTPKPPHPRLLL